MNELDKLIDFVLITYNNVSNKWKKNKNYKQINMSRVRVENVFDNEELLLNIFNYRNFINENSSEMMENFDKLSFNNIVSWRTKALNSIQYKIENYEKNHENGKIPIKKCLNDIFGIRMIFDDDITFIDVNNHLKEKYPMLKCIKSKKDKYNAIHIYFGNDDNKKFQWELQLWNKKDEKSNFISHKKHKQDYIKWEKDNNKGGN